MVPPTHPENIPPGKAPLLPFHHLGPARQSEVSPGKTLLLPPVDDLDGTEYLPQHLRILLLLELFEQRTQPIHLPDIAQRPCDLGAYLRGIIAYLLQQCRHNPRITPAYVHPEQNVRRVATHLDRSPGIVQHGDQARDRILSHEREVHNGVLPLPASFRQSYDTPVHSVAAAQEHQTAQNEPQPPSSVSHCSHLPTSRALSDHVSTDGSFNAFTFSFSFDSTDWLMYRVANAQPLQYSS